MKHRLLHILFIGAVFLSLTACIRDEENTELCPNEKVQVVFTLALDNEAQTRAPGDWTPGDYAPSELGDGYENHIEPGSLQVALYNTDNTFLTHVENLSYYQTGQINVYRFVGEVQVDKLQNNNLNCKVMVLANVANTLDDAANLSEFTFTRVNTYIPLWGVKTMNTALAPDTYTDLGVIYLLRAMAKVEVTLSDALVESGYSLRSVQMEHSNSTGYVLPTGWAVAANTEKLSLEGVLRPYASVSRTISFQESEVGKTYICYIPECENKPATDKLRMPLELFKGDEKVELDDCAIYFVDYNGDSGEMDVVRNHYYKFTITKIEDGKITLTLKYQVQEWTDKGNIDIGYN